MPEDGKKVAIGVVVVGAVMATVGAAYVLARREEELPPPPPPGLANLYGIVIDAVSGEALPDVLVILDSDQVYTDQNGLYAFVDLMPGDYTIQFFKEGYEGVVSMATLNEGQNTLNVQLIPVVVPAMLSGIVTDAETGQPIKGVKVTVNGMVTYTNTIGEYLFVDLVPGTYTVTFEKDGYEVLVK